MSQPEGQYPISAAFFTRLAGIIRPEEQRRLFTWIALLLIAVMGVSVEGELGRLLTYSAVILVVIIVLNDILKNWIKGEARPEARVVSTADYSLVEGPIQNPEKIILDLRKIALGQQSLPMPDGEIVGSAINQNEIRKYSADEKTQIGNQLKAELVMHDLELIRSLNKNRPAEIDQQNRNYQQVAVDEKK